MSRVPRRNRPVGGGLPFVKCTPVISLAVLAAGSLFAAPGRANAQQLPVSAFQTYNAADASSIVPGTFALFEVPVSQIQPGQLNVGFAEIEIGGQHCQARFIGHNHCQNNGLQQ